MTQIFLFIASGGQSGVGSFPDPGNWTSNNKIEVLANGGNGDSNSGSTGGPLELELEQRKNGITPLYATNSGPGGGGGGSAYGYQNNWTGFFPVNYYLTLSKNYVSTSGFHYGSGWNMNTSTVPAPANGVPGTVYAEMGYTNQGSSSTNYLAGVGGTYFYPNGFPGANGVAGVTGLGNTGGGGGGAGGPNGAGAVGSGITGGASDGGTVPGASVGGAKGNSGTQWGSYGVGSGGAGGISTATSGGVGGQYGAGGGGAYGVSSGTIAAVSGGDSLIIITYVPYVPPPPMAMIMN